jgi:hypothetical protein
MANLEINSLKKKEFTPAVEKMAFCTLPDTKFFFLEE